VAFVSLASLEARWNPDLPDPIGTVGEMVRDANRLLIDQAVAQGELGRGIDPSGAVALLEVFGAGLTLVAGGERDGDYPAMLDVLERLLDGTLFERAPQPHGASPVPAVPPLPPGVPGGSRGGVRGGVDART
jgi:hypothetical protein